MPNIPDPIIGTIQCTLGKHVQANINKPVGARIDPAIYIQRSELAVPLT